jgi:signal transduction histidine kinase
MPLIYILVFKSISSPYSSSSTDDLSEKEKRVRHPWRYLWLITAVFYLFWINYYADEAVVDRILDPMGMLYLVLIDAGSILIYRTIITTVDLYEKNLALLEENHAISIQRLSFESLNARLENMRRTRHDLRHHTALLKQIRKSGDLTALDELIDTYTEQNYLDQPLYFCENETVNIVTAFYSEIAYKNNISFSVKADIPEDIFVDRKDLAVVYGNILENATDACKEVDGDRFVDLATTYKTTAQGTHCLTLSVKNSYVTETTRNENGTFRSTKHEGDGIGIGSVQSITKKYGGACSFTPENGVFTVSVILYG